jgi:hypothetical protein
VLQRRGESRNGTLYGKGERGDGMLQGIRESSEWGLVGE